MFLVEAQGRSRESRDQQCQTKTSARVYHLGFKAHLEQVSAQIFLVFHLERDLLALGCDGSTGFDLVIPVSTSITIGRHDDDVLLVNCRNSDREDSAHLEIRNVDLLHQSLQLVSTARTRRRETENFLWHDTPRARFVVLVILLPPGLELLHR